MSELNRRRFLRAGAVLATAPGILSTLESSGSNAIGKAHNISVGIITDANNPEEDLKVVSGYGFSTCQINVAEYSPELAARLRESFKKYNILPNTMICMGPGNYVWDFKSGPETIGLVPPAFRKERVERLMKGIDFCKTVNIPAVHAHFGFIPENPTDMLYGQFIETIKPVAQYARQQGINVFFETGQETPITLLRALQDIGTDNLFVNYDTANLVMYGKANPLDGLKILGKYVRALHAKDGMYPTNPSELGKEVHIPTGEVDFPRIIATLKKSGFTGSLIIECELNGDNKDYITKTKRYLEDLIARA